MRFLNLRDYFQCPGVIQTSLPMLHLKFYSHVFLSLLCQPLALDTCICHHSDLKQRKHIFKVQSPKVIDWYQLVKATNTIILKIFLSFFIFKIEKCNLYIGSLEESAT